MYKGTYRRLIAGFKLEINEAREQCDDIQNAKKKKTDKQESYTLQTNPRKEL